MKNIVLKLAVPVSNFIATQVQLLNRHYINATWLARFYHSYINKHKQNTITAYVAYSNHDCDPNRIARTIIYTQTIW